HHGKLVRRAEGVAQLSFVETALLVLAEDSVGGEEQLGIGVGVERGEPAAQLLARRAAGELRERPRERPELAQPGRELDPEVTAAESIPPLSITPMGRSLIIWRVTARSKAAPYSSISASVSRRSAVGSPVQ